jgi:hypothetical protein
MKLDQKKIEYETISDVDHMLRIGITSVPMLKVDDELLDFNKAIEWVNNK